MQPLQFNENRPLDMRLIRLELENFRRIERATIHLSPATFIVGPNNTGKSSIIAAVEAILSLEKEKLSQQDILEHPDGTRADLTTITAYFGEIPDDVAASRGFRGRVIDGEYVYRKSLTVGSTKPKIETKEVPSSVKPTFSKAKRVKDLLDGGIPSAMVKDALGKSDPEEKLGKDWHRAIPDAVDFDTTAEPKWEPNPGGIPQNVLSRLPRLIHIPALTESKEIESGEKRYPLGECLALLFEDLIQATPLAEDIQTKLSELEAQMDPADEASLVHGLVNGINAIVADVFPRCGISIKPSLQGLLDILKPKYDIKVFSNIHTGIERQGTGLIRTCAFAMLRYHTRLKIEKDLQTRPILVGFEEPELFLHPSAGNLLRDTIYALGETDQIICTTHSPWMIDLGRDPQSITRMQLDNNDDVVATNYGISSALGRLDQEDKRRVKMIQIFDDELSRVFFSDCVVVVEGDSEILAIRQTLKHLPEATQKLILSRYQIVRARGKASIISLVKYLRELQIEPRVIHDGDFDVPGAERFNQPIAEALGRDDHLVVLDPDLEGAMGYEAPSRDKPYAAFQRAGGWDEPSDVPEAWRRAIETIFDVEWPE